MSGRGSQPAKLGQWRGEEYVVDLHQKVKVECVVADIPADDVIEAIREAANTGEPGDGKIFVVPVGETCQVRTGNRGRLRREQERQNSTLFLLATFALLFSI